MTGENADIQIYSYQNRDPVLETENYVNFSNLNKNKRDS